MKAKRKAAAAATTKTTAFSSDSSMDMENDNDFNINSNNNGNTLDAAAKGGDNVTDFDHNNNNNELQHVDNRNDNEEEVEEEEEGEEEEEEDNDDDDDEVEEEEEEERPKLDEGFFEIEAVRRKRVRKGQLQYLIRWRGWPETANTWEPLENLQSCSDVIDAFEESLRSGKSSRKRKRKYGGTHTQPKKKQPRSAASYNVTGVDISVVDKPLPSSLNNTSSVNLLAASGHQRENNGGATTGRTSRKADENGHVNGSKQMLDKKEDNEYDPKLSELRGIVSANDVNADNKLPINFHEENTPGVVDPTNGLSKVDYADAAQNSRRTGAKRRKSGSVKRFKKDTGMCEPVCLQNSPFFLQPSPLNVSVGLGAPTVPGIENGSVGNNSSYKPVGENSTTITKIVKPIGFSASVMDDVQNVLVTFLAMRSDGKEIMVDNSFLKANNPHLLIDFYEQHLKYST